MTRLSRLARRAAARTGLVDAALRVRKSQPLILMYHGVSPHQSFTGLRNSTGIHMNRQRFIEHLEVLRRHRRVIGVSEMAHGLREGEDLRNTVALTFDDGYANNVTEAAPLLVDFKMPASFYLATGFIGTQRWMWNDLLERLFESTACKQLAQPDGAVLPLASQPQRVEALATVKKRLKQLSVAERDLAVKALAEALTDKPTGVPTGDARFMDWTQARQLADAGFEVGAHTVNHAILSRLPIDEARSEVLRSRDAVVAGTGKCCPVFCYPNGKPEDYTAEVVDFCKAHFKAAIATRRGAARGDELYELARLSVVTGGDDLAWVLMRER
jgi:peptidoglycan/xylan/chitin deacetylase (PgdA/CDA1 family)